MISHAAMLSIPARVYFDGWESNTLTLQSHGWQLAADERPHDMRMCLMLRHPHYGLRFMSEWREFHYYRMKDPMFGGRDQDRPVFHVRHVGMDDTRFHISGEVNYNFREIDARPIWRENVMKFEDLCYFAKKGGPEIIVKPETVAELMEKIHKLNEPQLQAIQERNRTRAYGSQATEGRLVQHAQILSFVA